MLSLIEGIALVSALLLATYGIIFNRKSSLRLPPGPPGVPLLGNLLQLSPKRPHPQLLKWARTYGEIFHLRLGPQHMIVLNTVEAADELLVKRSRNYSDRTSPYVAHEILGDGQRVVLMPYNKEAKICRKTMQNAVGAGPSKRLRVYQDLESTVTLKDLLDHGNQSFGVPAPRSRNGDLHVPQDHWFSIMRRYVG
ncbi:hypothetical protein EIP86_002379 [Pleurotus ostreatoroseus]|nr:hypothetical protein EIP86_002379 [Pleurotus ostreatoroseus]